MKHKLLNTLIIASTISVYGCDNPQNEQQKEKLINGEVSTTDMNEVGDPTQHLTHRATGTVTLVDKENSHMVVELEPIPELNRPAESKPFQVEDVDELADIQRGDKVDLSFIEEQPGYYIALDLTER